MGLHVIIHSQHIVASGIAQRCHDGIVLSEISHQVDTAYIRVFPVEFYYLIECAVSRAVVDEYHLYAVHAGRLSCHAVETLLQILCDVVHRDDYTDKEFFVIVHV